MGGTIGGLVKGHTARKEGKRLEEASNNANLMQQQEYQRQRDDQSPWQSAGRYALSRLTNQRNFADFNMGDFEADPGYQFRLDEGSKAIERSAAARGGLNSGSTMKSLLNYGQNAASQEYNNAFNRFNINRDNRFNRLASLAGIGQTANAQVGQAGQNYANQFGANLTAGANARAAGNIAGINAIDAGISQDREMVRQGFGAMFCDERAKENISEISSEEIQEFTSAIKPRLFTYINSANGEGEFAGVMAQDLEKTRLGKLIVFENQQGHKMIDTHKAVMLLLALSGEGREKCQ